MKKIFLLFLLGICFAQTYEDVIYLKDGSVIHGLIIEEAPNEYIKIKSGRNIFVYQIDDIEKMTKEIIESKNNIKNKTASVQVGFGTHRALNFIGISKDFRIGDKGAFFITGGLGAALIGVGFAFQSDYNSNGLSVSAVLGVNALAQTFNSNIVYQFKIGNQTFGSIGLMAGILPYKDYTYYNGYIISFSPYIAPIFSIDFRF